MNTLFWSALLGIGLVEKLALAFRLNYWRRRATAVENAALTFAETPDEIAQERLIVRAAWNLMGLVLYVSAILLLLLLIFFSLARLHCTRWRCFYLDNICSRHCVRLAKAKAA